MIQNPVHQKQWYVPKFKKGDKVITQGGVYGEVAGVETAAVILKVADGVKIKVAKSGIAGLAEAPGSSK